MGSRRLGGNSRTLRKKKLKMSKRSSVLGSAVATSGGGITVAKGARLCLKKARGRSSARKLLTTIDSLRKQRSQLLKRQAAERMVLKEHTRDLEARRQRIRKGENAKTERRELGKYIRQLQEEQKTKHQSDLHAVEEALKIHRTTRGHEVSHDAEDWEDVEDDVDEIDKDELQDMFAHLTT
ncbi:hypothetical protein DQ04_01091080 [Trypanosoma grayi]|uniref:hypothetical protein n=1 Tax=Trypanosoma grayi TaxID=71804 RepID=UPI0004F48F3A|nr:hypothetical protein DQ04_01091080 [Trypanosoma grayi]KEG13301.1 hypothetical protein DQ04_01091080 [Trypanosoma grayi]